MEKRDAASRVKKILQYFTSRKDVLFNQLESTKQKLENICEDIGEQEKYLEIASKKELQKSCLFTLYDASSSYVEEKKQLAGRLAQMQVEKERYEILIRSLKQEFEQVNDMIVSSQLLLKGLEKDWNTLEEQLAGQTVKESETKEELAGRIKLCLDIFDLDKERCKLELKKLADELA